MMAMQGKASSVVDRRFPCRQKQSLILHFESYQYNVVTVSQILQANILHRPTKPADIQSDIFQHGSQAIACHAKL